MPRSLKSLAQMNADGIQYLAENTNITYLSEGSMARALVETNNLEVSRLQQYIATTYKNVFLNSAEGFYLDLIAEGLGLTRFGASKAAATAEDQNVQFSTATGKLGDFFPDPGNANLGLIPKGTTVSTADASITYTVPTAVSFPFGAKEVFVPVVANNAGEASRVGRNKLVSHSGASGVNVTNLKPISNGGIAETDRSFRFRLANHLAASPSANESAVRLAVIGNPDVARVELKEFTRGAGTFDVLLVPVGNTLTTATKSIVQSAVDIVSAFGVNGRVVEPEYVRFKISIQLVPIPGAKAGLVDAARLAARTAALDYIETIPLGGELIINRLRAAVIESVNNQVKDMKILDLCINGRPHSIRNIKLKPDQLFTPDVNRTEEAVQVV